MKRLYLIVVAVIIAIIVSLSPLANVRWVVVNDRVDERSQMAQWLKNQNWVWHGEAWLLANAPDTSKYEEITLKKQFPLTVELTCKVRAPFVAIKSGGYYVNIDMYGVVLNLTTEPEAPYVIHGFSVTSALVGNVLVVEEMRLIEKAVQIVYMFKTYTDYQPDVFLEDEQIFQRMSEDILINFGEGEDVELQFNNAIAAYQNMIANAGTSGIVNVSVPNQCIIEPLKR